MDAVDERQVNGMDRQEGLTGSADRAGRRKTALTHRPVRLAIVGGGAAGLFAAATAAKSRVDCMVFERKARVGSKMLMTANGRCNFTKDVSPARMLEDIGEPVASFAAHAIAACPPSRIAAWFRSRGLRVRRREDGCLFPASDRAVDVVHVFGDILRDCEMPLLTNCPVTGIQKVRNGFIVATRGFTVWAENVLVATGGMSFPKTGSVGDGQGFARELGLATEPCRAGLVGCLTRERRILSRVGARYGRGASAAVVAGGARLFCSCGEVEVEPWGLSGAAVYNCTRWAARHLPAGSRWALDLDLDGERMRIEDPQPRPLKEAIVTMGGVALSEVDPKTMESRRVPGLFFAGEVMDIDGPTGGYNLTLAFATACLAVESVAARSRA